MAINYYTQAQNQSKATLGNGFDQLIDAMANDVRLTGAISDIKLQGIMEATSGLLKILSEAVEKTGVGSEGTFSKSDVMTMNDYIRTHHAEEYDQLLTDFSAIKNQGSSSSFGGRNLLDTQMGRDLFSIGKELDPSASRFDVHLSNYTRNLNDFYTDRSTTNSGLDRITDAILGDRNLRNRRSEDVRHEGAEAADGMNKIILEAIEATGAAKDGKISVEDVKAINAYIRENHLDSFTQLHGDDEGRVETGFHQVQNDGARTSMFGENLVDTVADGIYHIGFEIENDRFVNEDGDQNASLEQVADWLNYFVIDQATTDTGMDKLVQNAQSDLGLASKNSAADIVTGLEAANELNKLIVESIEVQGLAKDGKLDINDVKAISDYIRENHLDRFMELRGTSDNGVETGFEAILNNGATQINDAKKTGCITWTGDNFVDTVMNGLYSVGFEISGDNFVNPADWFKRANDESGAFDEIIFQAMGSHEVDGGDGDDRIVSFSDGGEVAAAANGARINHEVPETVSSDTLTGGKGADTFEFNLLMNAREAIIKKHTDDAGNVNWMKVMKENSNVHDHWVEGIGNDVITDYNKAEGDKIVVRGHTVDIQSIEYGQDEQGDYSMISLFSNQMKGGAHNGDQLGTIKVYGDKVTAEDVELDGAMMVMDGVDMLSETFGGGVGPWGVLESNNLGSIASWLNEFYLEKEIKLGSEARDRIKGNESDDIIEGRAGNDQLNGNGGNDHIDGGVGADRILGGSGQDTLIGGDGNDKLYGGNDSDILIDGNGRDRSFGQAGDDVFLSHADGELDMFYGGKGDDTFMFWVDGQMNSDTIHFFRSGEDKIVLGGEVVNFSLHRAKRGFTDVKMFDENGEYLGKLRAKGVKESDIEINSDAFVEYSSQMLTIGVDVESDLEVNESIEANSESVSVTPVDVDIPVIPQASEPNLQASVQVGIFDF